MYPMHYGFVEATYARVEVSEMARQMQDFSSAIEENVPNAEEKYVKFKSARAISVQKVTEVIPQDFILTTALKLFPLSILKFVIFGP